MTAAAGGGIVARTTISESTSRTLQAAGLGVAVFVVYVAGASRTIYVGDSGELVAAVHLLGIPHPSGYPLYVLLGKLWTLLVPVGSIAFRMSLFSALCGAVAVAGLQRFLTGQGVGRLAAGTAALMLAFSPSFWSQANVQRVYTLNAVFVVATTALAFRWHRTGRRRDLLLAFFVCGLGATNHLFMGVYGVTLAIFVAIILARRRPHGNRRRTGPETGQGPLVDPGGGRAASTPLRWRDAPLAAAAFGGGLLPYLYLPLRSLADPRLDWGDPESPSGLVDVLLRRDMWDRAWVEGAADLLPVAGDYLASFAWELYGVGALLAIAGIVIGRRRGWPVTLPLLVMVANVAALASHGSRSDIFIWHRYYIPSYVMAALLAGPGLDALIRPRQGSPPDACGSRPSAGLRIVCLALPVVMLAAGWARFDRSDYRIAEDFSRTLLAELPPGSHLAASDDNILFVLIYLHLVEGLRPDIDLILQGVGGADLPPLRFDPDREPLFFTHHPNWNVAGIELVPRGLAYRVARAGSPIPPAVVRKERLDGEEDPGVPKDYLTRNLVGHFHFMLGVTFENRDWTRARRELSRAAAAAPDNDVLFYNLGLVYRRNGLLPEALAAFERAREIHPRYVGVDRDVRAGDRIVELRGEIERLGRVEAELTSTLTTRGLVPGDRAYHLALARLLEDRGELLAARGHRRRAQAASGTRGAAR